MIHYARIENSERLQRLRDYLADGKWHSTRDIVRGAEVCAVSSAVCELRRNNIAVEHKQDGKLHFYRRPMGQGDMFGVAA